MIRFDDMSFSYSAATHKALDHVDLEINDGEFVLVAGDSGSGKSTLLRCLNGLVPHFYGGRFGGRVLVNGVETAGTGVAELSATVGLVFQDSGAQIVAETVEEEISFGPLNLGLSHSQAAARAAQAIEEMGIQELAGRRTATLSGGEKQKVVIASVLSLNPSILALDEPLAELDPPSAIGLAKLLGDLNRRLGLTVIVAEHRLDALLPAADRIVEMEQGRAVCRQEGGQLQKTKDQGMRLREAVLQLGAVVLEARGLVVSYEDRQVLRGADLTVHAGEIVAIMGNNGAGKTTLLRSIAGFVKTAGGSVRISGRDTTGLPAADILRSAGYVPQRPSALLFAETVREELSGASLISEFGLESHAQDYPRDLSLGEQQRVALAAVMGNRPGLLLLDEPTHGLDRGAKARLAGILRAQASTGAAIVLATHDQDLASLVADRVLQLAAGRIHE